MNRRRTGSRYEAMAAAFLEERGLRVLARNYRCRLGEADLVCREGAVLVFVEVKYRRDASCGLPQEAVTPLKQRRLRDTARFYLLAHGLSQETVCRFDVVAILGQQLEWISDAF